MYKKGTVVLVPFPFTDLSGNKVRPALVVSQELRGEDVVVLFITSVKGRAESFDVPVAPTPENGLKVASRIKCAKIATLDKKIILGELGFVSAAVEKAVGQKLRTLFSI